MSVLDKIREANAATEPEHSIAVRYAVAVTVLISVGALVAQGFVRTGTAAVAIVGIPLGFLLSYRMRYSDALKLKAGLAVALIAAVVSFFGQLVSSFQEGLIDVQVPLAELFLWVQVVHSMHVPARRDLLFSLGSSAAMMAIAAALSISATLGIFIGAWMLALAVSLLLAYRSSIVDLPHLEAQPSESSGKTNDHLVTKEAPIAVARSVVILVAIAAACFLVLPNARASRVLNFPAELSNASPLGTPGSLSNPTLGDGGASGSDTIGSGGGASFGYFGFAEQLDTSLRGRPDGTLIMRVRAPEPAFWRGQAFDVWDGVTWTAADDTSTTIGGSAGPIPVPPTVGDDRFIADEFIQTFYIEKPGPNLVFGAYRPSEVYFDSRFLFQQPDGALRAGSDLTSGTVYTVVSERPNVTASLLRSRDPLTLGFGADLEPFLQLPDDVPQRVLDLAQEVTRDAPTTFDKIQAIEAWMSTNTTYSLDIPPLPDGADAVDDYLFVTQQGFCEQIGTSMVVMLRSLGVPARLAVGFVPGERNPLTGLYEVKASDAHSWAEVYFPGVGWQGFDPTAAVPLSGEFEPPATAGGALVGWIGANATQVGRWLAAVFGSALVLGFVVILANVALRIAQERRRKSGLTWVEAAVEELETIGTSRDRPRRPHETVREYVAALLAGPVADRRLHEVGETLTQAAHGSTVSDQERHAVQTIINSLGTARP